MSVYNLCRICLTEDINPEGMQPLFDANDKCIDIVQKIEECGGIVLKPHEEFPKMICYQCVSYLDTSFKFRSMCQASESALLNVIVKSEFKTEAQESGTPVDNVLPADSESDEIFFGEEVDFHEITDKEVHLTDIHEVQFERVDDNFHVNNDNTDNEVDFENCVEDEEFQLSAKKRNKLARTKSNIKKKVQSENVKRIRVKAMKVEALEEGEQKQESKYKNRGRKRKNDDHPASIMCELCGNIYNKQSLLNMHMRRHMANKPFECEICGKKFACPSEMRRHMRVHTGEKPYVCKHCGRTFADRSTNIKHERIHTNERPFSCHTCGKSFTYSNVLKNHMLTHTGEKPFSCLPCNKTFSRKHQLDQHTMTLTHQHTVKNLSGNLVLPVEVKA